MKRNVWRWIKDSISGQGTKEDIELDIYVYLYGKQYLRHDQENSDISEFKSIIGRWVSQQQFITCQIVKPISKFYHVISILPPEIVSRIYDVVSVEKPTEDSYSKLINALKTRLVKSKDNRLRFVLDEAQLNMSPSQFYYHLKSLSKDLKLSDELIFNRWLKKLPNDQMID
ncbi:hypothetical protein BLOT_001734 [Blomia tropicalis]|nr:hypothetical protein BLOT_001734 [Blomia tropicalis]